ncbi:MAG TPA: hypothetical protein O0X68_02730, partial [Methanocorpusculum sp.]|nr:hypothetical protein [Methanocorpusculum sp.]
MPEQKIVELYHTVQRRKVLVFGALVVLLLITSVLACGIGTVAIPPADVLAAFGYDEPDDDEEYVTINGWMT